VLLGSALVLVRRLRVVGDRGCVPYGPVVLKVAFGGRLHVYPPAVELISSPILSEAYDRLGSGSVGRTLLDQGRRWICYGSPATWAR
jgi:hypothetical protein